MILSSHLFIYISTYVDWYGVNSIKRNFNECSIIRLHTSFHIATPPHPHRLTMSLKAKQNTRRHAVPLHYTTKCYHKYSVFFIFTTFKHVLCIKRISDNIKCISNNIAYNVEHNTCIMNQPPSQKFHTRNYVKQSALRVA